MEIIKKTLVVLILWSLIVGTVPISVLAQQNSPDNQIFEYKEPNLPEGVEYAPGELIVKFKPGASNKEIANINSRHGTSVIYTSPNAGLKRLHVPNGKSVHGMVEKYKNSPYVEYAEPNYKVYVDATIPNDNSFSLLWGMHNTGQSGGTEDADIDAPEAWDIETGNFNEVVIAVIDTGVDYNHVDLAANMWNNTGEIPGNGIDDDGNGYIDDIRGWDFFNNDSNPYDESGHGTHCSGTIAAVGNNSIGVVGVSWNAKIMPLRFLGPEGGYTYDAVLAINYAIDNGADIMSNSWGGGGFSQALKDAISAANNAGILFIASAGNNYTNNDVSPHYPSSYDVPNVIAVAATDHDDDLANFPSWGSNYGLTSVDLAAPGVSIYSTTPTDGYDTYSGTSMATPHVAGAAALIKAQYPELSSDGIKARLLGSVDPIPSLSGITVTGGRLNAYSALELDNTPPSAISSLIAGSPTSSTITLNWFAPGDDGNSGTAKLYDVRYSTSDIETDADWEAATSATGEPKPQSSESAETYTVTGLSYNTNYYFAVKAIDNVGNPSLLSNIVSENTGTPTIVFYDDMENGINGWTHSGSNDNWELGLPTSGPNSAYSGSNVWATNLDGNYIDRMNAELVSPSFDLTGIIYAQLTFMHYYSIESHYDGGIVEISSDGGSTWVQMTPVGGYPEDALYYRNPLGSVPAYSGRPGFGWHQQVFDISSYDGSSNIMIRFRFGTDISVTDSGWYIDDVTVMGDSGESNSPPIADASGPYSGIEDTAISFDGSGSSDPDGDDLTYEWDFGDQSTGTGANPTHTYAAGGTYTVTLVVNDGTVDSAPNTTTATVTEVNDPPVADAGGPYSGIEDTAISFDRSGSSDPDGDDLTYEWDFGDSSTGTGANPTHTYAAGGTYTVTLVVSDGTVDSAPNTTTATVTEVNDPPVANAGGPYSGTEGTAISFDGSGSFDPDGTIVSYDWDFGDGNTGTGMSTPHAYSNADTYTVTLKVTDEDGATCTDTAEITVTEAPALTMHFKSIDMSTTTIKLNGWYTYATAIVTVIDATDYPVPGAKVYGQWSGATQEVVVAHTDNEGNVSFNSDNVKNAKGSEFVFTVINIELDGFYYDESPSVTSGSISCIKNGLIKKKK